MNCLNWKGEKFFIHRMSSEDLVLNHTNIHKICLIEIIKVMLVTIVVVLLNECINVLNVPSIF